MNKVEQLKTILEEMDYAGMMEIVDHPWYIEDNETVYWNVENDEEALISAEGETYCGWVVEETSQYEGYTIMNVDTQQGYWQTLLFNNEQKVE